MEEMIPVDIGYRYTYNNQNEMVEYHVDLCHVFQDRLNEKAKFGGNRSVRLSKEERPMMLYGHEELILKQYLLIGKTWIGSNGEKQKPQKMKVRGS